MKQTKFSKLENNYYYGISRLFWHIIIGLGALAIISGIAVLIWSQIPASKNKVVKEEAPFKKAYPKPVGVSLNELKSLLPKGKEELEKEKNNVTEILGNRNTDFEVVEDEVVERDTVGLSKFNTQIDALKRLIPVQQNLSIWEGQGYYYFMNSRDERLYKRNKATHLRLWKSTSKGFENEFIKKTDGQKYNLKSYTDKAILLTSYNNFLKNVDKKNRAPLLNDLVRFYSKKGLNEATTIIETIAKTIKSIDSKEQIEAFNVLERFSRHNPSDGLGLVTFEQGILHNFEVNQRLNIIKTINKEYSNNYDFQLAAIIDNTKQFIPMLSSFKGNQQPVALQKFYILFKSKNRNRDTQIQRINNQYQSDIRDVDLKYQNDLVQAESNYAVKKVKKSNMKWASLKSMAYGLGVVLLISLILLILSMIRNVNRLAEAMLKKQ